MVPELSQGYSRNEFFLGTSFIKQNLEKFIFMCVSTPKGRCAQFVAT